MVPVDAAYFWKAPDPSVETLNAVANSGMASITLYYHIVFNMFSTWNLKVQRQFVQLEC